jgi:hypothetical protein
MDLFGVGVSLFFVVICAWSSIMAFKSYLRDKKYHTDMYIFASMLFYTLEFTVTLITSLFGVNITNIFYFTHVMEIGVYWCFLIIALRLYPMRDEIFRVLFAGGFAGSVISVGIAMWLGGGTVISNDFNSVQGAGSAQDIFIYILNGTLVLIGTLLFLKSNVKFLSIGMIPAIISEWTHAFNSIFFQYKNESLITLEWIAGAFALFAMFILLKSVYFPNRDTMYDVRKEDDIDIFSW